MLIYIIKSCLKKLKHKINIRTRSPFLLALLSLSLSLCVCKNHKPAKKICIYHANLYALLYS